MLLGKRPRPPIMRRTTSMSGMSLDMQLTNLEAEEPSHSDATTKDPNDNNAMMASLMPPAPAPAHTSSTTLPHDHQQRFMPSPTNTNTNTNQTIDTPHFLRSCGLCKRRLAPGRDIYMYRGDTAFCSLECREQRMKEDERKDKWKVGSNSKKEDPHAHASSSPEAASSKSETIAAA